MVLFGLSKKPLNTTQGDWVFGVVIDLIEKLGGHWQVNFEMESRWKDDAIEVTLVISNPKEPHNAPKLDRLSQRKDII